MKMYKMRLQEMCHRRRWNLPEYSAIHVDGPPHNPSFKGSVFVNGLTFTSSDTFHSSKEAHNQAAMKALLNFSSPSSSTILFSLFWVCYLQMRFLFEFLDCLLMIASFIYSFFIFMVELRVIILFSYEKCL